MTEHVNEFVEGDKDLLDGEGANLAEMTDLGLPVPPGLTITTPAGEEYLREVRESGARWAQVTTALRHLEDGTGHRSGGRRDRPLVSVRSGAQFHKAIRRRRRRMVRGRPCAKAAR